MNFNEFANKYFDSDKSKALQQLVVESFSREYTYTKSHKELQNIVHKLDGIVADEYMKYYYEFIKKNPEYHSKWLSAQYYRILVKMEDKEILSYQKNPFSKKLKISFLLCIAVYVIFNIISSYLTKSTSLSPTGNTILDISSYFIIELPALFSLLYAIRFWCFKRLKKIAIEKSNLSPDFSFASNNNPNINDLVAKSLLANESYNGPKESLNTKTIVKVLNEVLKPHRTGYVILGVLGLFFISISAFFSLILAAILFVAVETPFAVLYIKATIKLNNANALKFRIITDKCIKKKDVYDSEDHSYDGASVEFANYGKFRIYDMSGSADKEISSLARITARSIKENDECYLVILDGQKKILFAFPKNRYVIDSHEFCCEENGYIPIRKN